MEQLATGDKFDDQQRLETWDLVGCLPLMCVTTKLSE